MEKTILITGGSGMVGKALKDIMPNAIYLSSKDCDLRNQEEVKTLFKKINPDICVHMAARVGGIIDNISHPAEYFDDNVLMNTNVIKESYNSGVDQFIGILSTCIYPDKFDSYPMKEDDLHKGPPTPTNFSYAYSKRCLAVQIDAYNQEYGTNYNYLIPSNLYGKNDKYGNNSHFVASLIKKIYDAKQQKSDHINLFGTGTPLRQFMYAGDLAFIIKYCIDNNITESFNVASEENYSIKKIAEIALNACDANNLKIEFDTSKPDGQYRKDVSIEKMKTIIPNFKPTKLFEGIKKTYNIEKEIWKKKL